MEKQPFILVVDDEEPLLKLLSVTLTVEGYRVLTASGGETALQLLAEHEPELVILDIVMPGLDGLQLLGLIRQSSNVPVIMLTGKCEVATVREALALGADDYVRKPFSILELTARVKAKLRRAGQPVTGAQPFPQRSLDVAVAEGV